METKVEKKMYGDYQEMKSGEEEEGHVFLNSDNIFGSVSSSPTTTIQNPNYKFTSFDNPNFPYIFPVCLRFQPKTLTFFTSYFLKS